MPINVSIKVEDPEVEELLGYLYKKNKSIQEQVAIVNRAFRWLQLCDKWNAVYPATKGEDKCPVISADLSGSVLSEQRIEDISAPPLQASLHNLGE
jgi:hypothetical protein